MKPGLAKWLNERGRKCDRQGKVDRAIYYYKLATETAPNWSVPWYNLGLLTKYQGKWEESLHFNQRAVELDPQNEAGWWNLGIAATALSDWREARRAWKSYGIRGMEGEGEVRIGPLDACVRLDPNGAGEVVWGDRIDPARFVILNVPLPNSGRRFRDVVLHDGAQNGTRMRRDREIPVFDELGLWHKSEYSTFELELHIGDQAAEDDLVRTARENKFGIENWSSVRLICRECSVGNPGAHDHKPEPPPDGSRRFAR